MYCYSIIQVVTSVSNPLSQEEFEVDSVVQDKRHELVDYNSGLSEDDDDDDVRDGSEVLGISYKIKESTNSKNPHSNAKLSHNSHKQENRPKKYSKSALNDLDSTEKRAHSNDITSPTVENGPKLTSECSTTRQSEQRNFSAPSHNRSPTKPPIQPNPDLSPNHEAMKRPSESSF